MSSLAPLALSSGSEPLRLDCIRPPGSRSGGPEPETGINYGYCSCHLAFGSWSNHRFVGAAPQPSALIRRVRNPQLRPHTQVTHDRTRAPTRADRGSRTGISAVAATSVTLGTLLQLITATPPPSCHGADVSLRVRSSVSRCNQLRRRCGLRHFRPNESRADAQPHPTRPTCPSSSSSRSDSYLPPPTPTPHTGTGYMPYRTALHSGRN